MKEAQKVQGGKVEQVDDRGFSFAFITFVSVNFSMSNFWLKFHGLKTCLFQLVTLNVLFLVNATLWNVESICKTAAGPVFGLEQFQLLQGQFFIEKERYLLIQYSLTMNIVRGQV